MDSLKSLVWDKKYEVGHDIVDNEHKKLFELVKRIVNCKKDKDVIVEASKELVEYTKVHFADEEEYMESINFNLLEEHRQIHKDIVNKLNEFLLQMSFIGVEQIINTIEEFVNEYIVEHILVEDRKMVGVS